MPEPTAAEVLDELIAELEREADIQHKSWEDILAHGIEIAIDLMKAKREALK